MNGADDSKEHEAVSRDPDVVPPAPSREPSGWLPADSAAPAFHSDDVEHVANYQSLSVQAIISLLIGLASPLCNVSRVFLAVPLFGMAISLLALRRIALSEGRLAGRWAAIIGLALCVASGAAAISRNSVTRYLRTTQAEEFGRNWLQRIVSNDMDRAFKATYDGARPLAPPDPGMPAPEKTPYETFLNDQLIQRISAAGKDAKIEYDGTLEFTAQTRRDVTVRQRFLIVPASNATKSGSAQPIEVYLTLQRARFRGERNSRWLVMRYEPTNVPAK